MSNRLPGPIVHQHLETHGEERSAASELPALLERAKRSCLEAAQRFHHAQRGLDDLLRTERAGLAVDVARRTHELAHYRVAAARLAWFNAVVHHERMKARCRHDPDGLESE